MITINGIKVLTAKFHFTWRGVWTATLDIDSPQTVLSGKVSIIVGSRTITGTVDDKATGTFGNFTRVTVLGGAGGWSKVIAARHLNNSNGLSSATVTQYAASQVGEIVTESSPITYGPDYIITNRPASQVFEGRDYYVDPVTGITIVAGWPAATLPKAAQFQEWDPTHMQAIIASEELIYPGTVLSDPRLNGVDQTIRDVVQTYSGDEGFHATCTCSNSTVSRLREALTTLIRELGGTATLKNYRYRYVLGSDNNLALQAISPGAPDLRPVPQWSGLSGTNTSYQPGTEIVVGFTADTPPSPFLLAVSPNATPTAFTHTTSGTYNINASAVNLAGGADHVGLAAKIDAVVAAIVIAFNAHVHTGVTVGVASSGPPATPLNAQPSVAATKTKAT